MNTARNTMGGTTGTNQRPVPELVREILAMTRHARIRDVMEAAMTASAVLAVEIGRSSDAFVEAADMTHQLARAERRRRESDD